MDDLTGKISELLQNPAIASLLSQFGAPQGETPEAQPESAPPAPPPSVPQASAQGNPLSGLGPVSYTHLFPFQGEELRPRADRRKQFHRRSHGQEKQHPDVYKRQGLRPRISNGPLTFCALPLEPPF